MDQGAIYMAEDAALKLYRLAEQFFSRPENSEIFQTLFEEDRLKQKGA